MFRARHNLFFCLLLAALAAGSPYTGRAADVIHRGGTGDPATLDPHRIVDPWESTVVMDLFIGLTSLDPGARVIPGAAESWQVSDDGKTYIFHLREGLQWSDGEPLTAADYEFSFRRMVDPETACPFAMRHYIIRNARAINAGEREVESLGVRAIDARTLEIELIEPAHYFPELIVHRGLPVPRHVIANHGNAWIRPGNMVSNGAFALREWIPNEHVRLVKNPRFYNSDEVRLDEIYHHPAEDTNTALRRFRAGELDIVVSVPSEQLDWIKENLGTSLHMVPGFGIQHFVFNTRKAPFDDVRVRQALTMAIDREIITSKLLRAGEQPATGVIPSQASHYPERAVFVFSGLSQAQRIQRARELLAAAGFGPHNPLTLTLSYNTHEVHRKVAVAAASMWKRIGVQTRLLNFEAKVLLSNLREGNFDIGRYLWLAETSDALSFLERMHGEAGALNQAGYTNPDFDALLDEARLTADLERRAALLHRAEALVLRDLPIIPLYFYAGRRLVAPHVKGWGDNARGINLARDFWIER